MNIVVSINKQYVLPLKAMLVSLLRFHQNIDLWIINMEGLKEEDFIPLFSVLNKENIHIKEMPHYLENDTRFSPSSLSRIFTPFLLTDIDRALYLDVDIIIRRSIESFYNSNFKNKGIIAVTDEFCNKLSGYKEWIGLCDKDNYVNSGVLLMNLDYLRKRYSYETVLEAFENFVPNTTFIDQDFINIFFRDDILTVDKTYNYQIQFVSYFIKGCKNPHILHYIGEHKPWETKYYKSYFFEYKSIWKETTGQDLSSLRYIFNLFKMVFVLFGVIVRDKLFKRIVKDNEH